MRRGKVCPRLRLVMGREEKEGIMPSGVVAAVQTVSRRRIVNVRQTDGEPPKQFRVEVKKKYEIQVGDEVRVEGNIVYWTPAGETVTNIPVQVYPSRPRKDQ
jgi:hypothetical protein